MVQVCIHGFVSGKVQGVWYRGSTRQKAAEQGVNGWARNLPDGRVEVMLCGEEQAVNNVVAWLNDGPPGSHVTDVKIRSLPFENISGFSIY